MIPDTQEPRDSQHRTASVRAVATACLVTAVLATLFNAAALLETAERQQFGTRLRSITVAMMEPISTLSSTLHFDEPRTLIDRAIGRGKPTTTAGQPQEPIAATTTATEPATSAPPTTTGEGAQTSTTLVADTTTSTEPAPPPLVSPTADDPLRIWIIGDSFLEILGPAIGKGATATGVVEYELDFRFITGLVRPDYFDWMAHIAAEIPQVAPDVVVAMFGGNDSQRMTWNGVRLEEDTAEWHAAYGEIVGAAMDALLAGGATRVYWIGLPIMRSNNFTRSVIGMNAVYAAEADERDGVTYISSFELFQDENGEYSTYLPNAEGDLRKLRAADGAHLWFAGADRLAAVVLQVIFDEWGITPPS